MFTLRGSYGECKGWCLIMVLQLVRGILPESGSCEMSKCISTAQARTKCGSWFWSAVLNFRIKVAPVKRPSAFQLRRLAQSVCRGCGRPHFTFKFLYKVALVKRPSAFRLRRRAQSMGNGSGRRHCTCKFPDWLL